MVNRDASSAAVTVFLVSLLASPLFIANRPNGSGNKGKMVSRFDKPLSDGSDYCNNPRYRFCFGKEGERSLIIGGKRRRRVYESRGVVKCSAGIVLNQMGQR